MNMTKKLTLSNDLVSSPVILAFQLLPGSACAGLLLQAVLVPIPESSTIGCHKPSNSGPSCRVSLLVYDPIAYLPLDAWL